MSLKCCNLEWWHLDLNDEFSKIRITQNCIILTFYPRGWFTYIKHDIRKNGKSVQPGTGKHKEDTPSSRAQLFPRPRKLQVKAPTDGDKACWHPANGRIKVTQGVHKRAQSLSIQRWHPQFVNSQDQQRRGAKQQIDSSQVQNEHRKSIPVPLQPKSANGALKV